MKGYQRSLPTIMLLMLLASGPASGQDLPSRGRQPRPEVTHTLLGDFKIDTGNSGENKLGAFRLLLYTLAGRQVAQQSINNGGRYHFNNVANGEYVIAVEMDGTEVHRFNIRIDAIFSSDIRRDILMEMRGGTAAGPAAAPATAYARSAENKTLFDKALAAEKKNDLKQAAALLNQVVKADSKDYEAWTELGTVYFKQEKYGDAEKAYQNALAEKPGFFLALLNLGKTQIAEKKFDDSITTLTRAVEADPRSAGANFFLGEAYLQVKKGSKAVGYLNEALKLDPIGMADAHLRLGVLYRGAGLKDKAVAEFEQFLAKRPNHPDKAMIEQYIKENKQK